MTRPSPSLNPLYLNVPARPVVSSRQAPRIVCNRLPLLNKKYSLDGTTSWAKVPSSSPPITTGFETDGGQWFEFTSTAAVTERVYVAFTLPVVAGTKYIVSGYVDSKTGTHAAVNVQVLGQTFTGTSFITNPAVGRFALAVTATTTGDSTVRLGIGTNTNNANNATIRISKVMIEIPETQSRSYPYEYVTPDDCRAFPYTHVGSMTGTVVNAPTLGSPYAIPARSSVLAIGDSFANNSDVHAAEPGAYGDFPWQMRRWFSGAVNGRGVSGGRIEEITTLLTAVLAETDNTAGVAPYSVIIAQGGINDVVQGRTLSQMQEAKLAQIQTILAAGAKPVLVGIAPYNSASGDQQTIIDGFNAWLKTLGYPMYDLYADANNGSGDLKTSWDVGDGVHPLQTVSGGAAIMGQRLADLIQLIGD